MSKCGNNIYSIAEAVSIDEDRCDREGREDDGEAGDPTCLIAKSEAAERASAVYVESRSGVTVADGPRNNHPVNIILNNREAEVHGETG